MVATLHDGAGQGGHQVGRLSGEHDEELHGPLQADKSTAGRLASVADLVRFVRQRDARPLVEAAELVLAELAESVPPVELFETRPGDWARAVDEDWSCPAPGADAPAAFRLDVSFWEQVPPPLQGHAGALAALRAAWLEAPATRAALAALPCVRLAVRRSWAAEVFGYGEAAEPAPVLPAALPRHDADRWGIARTFAARPVDLVRVADAVRAAMRPGGAHAKGLPLKRAAAWVLEGLADLPAHAWHQLKPGDDPRRISDADEWRPSYAAGSHYQAELRAADAFALIASLSVFEQLDPVEAAARGLRGDPAAWPNHYATEAAHWPALPALRGVAGARQWLHACWVDGSELEADLDKGTAALLAVPARAVAALAWLVPDAGAELGAADVAPAKQEPAAADWVVQPAGGRWPHVAGEWTDAERKAAFLMRHKHKRSDADLVRVIGVSRQAINDQIGGAYRTIAKAKAPAWPDNWRPSSDLLRECGLPVPALQALQIACTGGR